MSNLALCRFLLEEEVANFLSICSQLFTFLSLAEGFFILLLFKSSVLKIKSFLV